MRKHPKFLPPNYGRKKRVKERWRRPRGIDSKKRIHKRIMGASPLIGRRSPRNQRHIHPSGMKEVLIRNISDLAGLTGLKGGVVVRISSSFGSKKRTIIAEKAKSMGLRIVNYKPKQEQKLKTEEKTEQKGQEQSKPIQQSQQPSLQQYNQQTKQ